MSQEIKETLIPVFEAFELAKNGIVDSNVVRELKKLDISKLRTLLDEKAKPKSRRTIKKVPSKQTKKAIR